MLFFARAGVFRQMNPELLDLIHFILSGRCAGLLLGVMNLSSGCTLVETRTVLLDFFCWD
jgi:hypothetical protein